jgi:hypothetical protein
MQGVCAAHGGHFHHVNGGHDVAVAIDELLDLGDITKLPKL